MEEIKIYSDKEATQEVSEITFEPVEAGKTTVRKLFFKNIIKYPIKVFLESNEKDVEIFKEKFDIKPNEIEGVDIIFFPKKISMKPFNFELKINLNYIIT